MWNLRQELLCTPLLHSNVGGMFKNSFWLCQGNCCLPPHYSLANSFHGWTNIWAKTNSPVLFSGAALLCLVVCHHHYCHYFSRRQNGCHEGKEKTEEEENNTSGSERLLAKVASGLLIFLYYYKLQARNNLTSSIVLADILLQMNSYPTWTDT